MPARPTRPSQHLHVAKIGVDPKSVERWLALGRVPHRANRWDAARRLGYEEDYLWPEAPGRGQERRDGATRSELVRLYPDRGSVPRATWHQLLGDGPPYPQCR
jgi:hypothetical protein